MSLYAQALCELSFCPGLTDESVGTLKLPSAKATCARSASPSVTDEILRSPRLPSARATTICARSKGNIATMVSYEASVALVEKSYL